MEALLHTYDKLDQKACKKFHPLVIKSNSININETELKSIRNWGVILLYWAAFLSIVSNAPTHAYKGHLILNPLKLFIITEDYFFALAMTLIWWACIIITLHLSYVLISRIKGYYFDKSHQL